MELWRYPVKSLGGEQVDSVRCTRRGLAGDRRWAVRAADGKLGSGKSTRRFRRMPGLLSLSATTDADGTVWIVFPDGTRRRVDDPTTARLVGEVVGEPVTFTEEAELSHFDAAALHLLTTASLRWLAGRHPDVGVQTRRFRPNVVVEVDRPEGPGPAQAGPAQPGPAQGGPAQPEETWVGCTLTVGSATVAVEEATERCAMITLAQPGLAFAPGILGDLRRQVGCRLGVYGQVVADGHLGVGDAVIRSA